MVDILTERQGWGNQTTGGAGGESIVVSNLAGLRAALESPNPAYVTFAVSMTIATDAPIRVKSNKTLDGRGKSIVLKGKPTDAGTPLWLQDVENIIISDIAFDGQWPTYTQSSDVGGDAIRFWNVNNIWIHHCKATHFSDGVFDCKPDTVNGNVSITWCRIIEQYKLCMCHGGLFSLGCNYLKKVGFRFPLGGGGAKIHSYNNLIEDWQKPLIQYTKSKSQLWSHRNLWVPKRINKVGDKGEPDIIKNDTHKTYGAMTFYPMNSKVDPQFMADSLANAKVTICSSTAQWDALKAKLTNETGPRVNANASA